MAEKTYLFINKNTAKALEVTGSENGSPIVQNEVNNTDAQLWYAVKISKDTYKLVSKSAGKVLDLAMAGTANGTHAHIWDDLDSVSQTFSIVNASRGFRKIVNVNAGKVLDIKDLSEENGATIQLWDDLSGDNQEWKMQEFPKVVKKATTKKKTTKNK